MRVFFKRRHWEWKIRSHPTRITYTLPTSRLADLTSYDYSSLPTNTELLWTPNFCTSFLNMFPFQRNLVPLIKMLYLGFHAFHVWLCFIWISFQMSYLRVPTALSKTNHNIRIVLYLVYNSFESWHFILYLGCVFYHFLFTHWNLISLRIVFSTLLSVPSTIPTDLLWLLLSLSVMSDSLQPQWL